MQISSYPSPPPSEAESMDRGQRLPPITTQLAGYFQQKDHRPNTPPISPADARPGETSSLKRKRSETQVSDEQTQPPPKRSAAEPEIQRPATCMPFERSQSQRRSQTEGEGRSPVNRPGQMGHPADSDHHHQRRPASHSPKHNTMASPQSGSAHSTSRPEYHSYQRPAEYREHNTTYATPTDTESSYSRSTNQPIRSLPPLITPQSPRSALDGKFDSTQLPAIRHHLPPIESSSAYQSSSSSSYAHPSYAPSSSSNAPQGSRHLPSLTADSSSYATTSPQQRPAGQAHSYPPSYSYEPSRSSYSYSPRRGQFYPNEERPRQLPPMRDVEQFPPPASQLSLSGQATSSQPMDRMDRYRFDPNATADHPARRRRGNLPKEATACLNDWFAAHHNYPYPKEEEKQRLQEQTGLSMSQIGNWFINARRRRKPPQAPLAPIEAMPGRHTYASQVAPRVPSSLPPPRPHEPPFEQYNALPPIYRR